jgi:hypothetical protein
MAAARRDGGTAGGGPVRPTSLRSLLLVGVACAAAGWLIARAAFARLPALPWTAVPAMALLAIGETLTGRSIRARLAGRRTAKPLQPLAVARVVALAKASSAVAACLGGLAAGFGGFLAGSLAKPVARADTFAAAGTLAAALALTAAALFLERSCRTPGEPADDADGPGGQEDADPGQNGAGQGPAGW